MILPKAFKLKALTHPDTPPHPHHTHHTQRTNQPSQPPLSHEPWMTLITIKLTEDVPDQRKAQRVIDSKHEYTAWFYEMRCSITAFLLLLTNKNAVLFFITLLCRHVWIKYE